MKNLFLVVMASIIATLSMDLFALLLHYLIGYTIEWGSIGNWVINIISGNIVYKDVLQLPARQGEAAVGWITHYLTGFIYVCIYIFLNKINVIRKVSIWSCLIFLWILMVAPFFVVGPAMGAGILDNLTPSPTTARLLTLGFHTVFGIGMYIGIRIWHIKENLLHCR